MKVPPRDKFIQSHPHRTSDIGSCQWRHAPSLRSVLRKTLAVLLCFCCIYTNPRNDGNDPHNGTTGWGCWAKEVVATYEWTLLGENDTVAAGMHVRMDLSTGQKWVKLPNDKDDEEDDETKKPSVQVSAEHQVQIGPAVIRGGLSAVSVGVDGQIQSSEHRNPDSNQRYGVDEELALYDYDMMHRTLSQLPDEEKVRMQLPELPAGITSAKSLTAAEREAFEVKMRKIWEMRQEQLKQFEKEFLIDLPEILKERIRRIQEYLSNPYAHLMEINLDDNEHQEGTVTHIVSVLEDLEFLLTDIDMTRDFHTLGGWPLLASLLSNRVHEPANHTLTDDLWEKIFVVQSRAAWGLGTAVKNTGEFMLYAVEEMWINEEKTTPLDLLLSQLVSDLDKRQGLLVPSPAWCEKERKVLYAIGSLLRGNRRALLHFCASNGPSLLAKRLKLAVEEGSPDAQKISVRLLALAEDMLTDARLHQDVGRQEVDDAMAKAFANPEWCTATLSLSVAPSSATTKSLREATIKAMRELKPFCDWPPDLLLVAIDTHMHWLELQKESLEPEHYTELMDIVKSTQSAIRLV